MTTTAQPSFAARARAHSGAGRYDRLDLLRGVAIVWMAVYHFLSLIHI